MLRIDRGRQTNICILLRANGSFKLRCLPKIYRRPVFELVRSRYHLMKGLMDDIYDMALKDETTAEETKTMTGLIYDNHCHVPLTTVTQTMIPGIDKLLGDMVTTATTNYLILFCLVSALEIYVRCSCKFWPRVFASTERRFVAIDYLIV